MSSNLVKQKYLVVSEDDSKRLIDNNGRMRKHMESIRETMGRSGDGGFVSGILAGTVEVLANDGDADTNVLKAVEDSGVVLEQAKGEAQKILQDAKDEASQIILDARKQAEQEKNKIINQSQKQGYDEGMAQAKAKERALEQEYSRKMQELEAFYAEQLNVMEPQLVDVITDVYEHIFRVELDAYREILLHLIQSTLHKADGGREFLVHVSEEDYSFVNEHKHVLLEKLGDSCRVDVIESPVVGVGQCMIEAESGIFDCGLGTQLEELKKRLMLLAWSKED